MKTLTLKEFVMALNARIARYTYEELKEIILAQGMALDRNSIFFCERELFFLSLRRARAFQEPWQIP